MILWLYYRGHGSEVSHVGLHKVQVGILPKNLPATILKDQGPVLAFLLKLRKGWLEDA